MENNLCEKCSVEPVLKKGTMTHILFGKEIKIHNVPYLQCEQCGFEKYVSTHTVDILIRDAYRSGNSEVEYPES